MNTVFMVIVVDQHWRREHWHHYSVQQCSMRLTKPACARVPVAPQCATMKRNG